MFNVEISYNIAYKILFTILYYHNTILRTKYCLQYCITILVSGGFTYVGIPYTQTHRQTDTRRQFNHFR